MLLCQTAELGNIVIAGEIKLTWLLFVQVPEHIQTKGIHTQSLTRKNTLFPVRFRDTRIMYLRSFHYKRLSIQQERIFPNFKRSTGLRALT